MVRFRDEITLTKDEGLDILALAVEAASYAATHGLTDFEFRFDGVRRLLEDRLAKE